MNEVEAIIQAANVQADATIHAAWWAAFGIATGVIGSWCTSLHLQKNNRITETRREIYSETVGAYSSMCSVIASLHADPGTAQSKLLEVVEKFAIGLDKAMFVCETRTKAEIVDFYETYLPFIENFANNLGTFLDKYNTLENEKKRHDETMEELNEIWKKLDEISIENPKDQKILNTLDLINRKIDESSKIIDQIDKAESSYIEEVNILINEFYKNFDKLNVKAINVMYFLRQEIGIKTDLEYDMKLNNRLKIIANRHDQ